MSAAAVIRKPYKNRILATLPKVEIASLAPYLFPLILGINTTLLAPGEESAYAYFLESGMASTVIQMSDGNTVESGITGNEGLVGIPALLGTKTMPTRTFMQIAGSGYRVKAHRLSEQFEKPGALRKQINRYFQTYLIQTSQTAACNRLHDIAERLARWLLMCHDRMNSDHFAITQEFLGHMLGTPRTTVTMAAGILQKAGWIHYSRGRIHVRDRKGLEKAACECYRAIRNESDRLGVASV